MFTFVRDLTPIQPVHDGKSWEGRTYSMFRAVHATHDGYITYVRACIDGVICIMRETFDREWNSLGDTQKMGADVRAEDPRLVAVDGDLYVVFIGDSPFPNQYKCIWLLRDGEQKAIPLSLPGANFIEKNWAPFEYRGKLMFVYNYEPLILLHCETSTGKCTVIRGELPFDTSKTFLRGGSNLLPTRWGDGGYVGFAHSRLPIDPSVRPGFLHLTHMVRLNARLELVSVSEPVYYTAKDGGTLRETIQDPVSCWREDGRMYTTANVRDNFCEMYEFSEQSWNARVRRMLETTRDSWYLEKSAHIQ